MLKHLTTGRDQRDCECVCVCKKEKERNCKKCIMYRQKETQIDRQTHDQTERDKLQKYNKYWY